MSADGDKILGTIREARRPARRGAGEPVVHVPPEVDVKAWRRKLGMSRSQFAASFGLPSPWSRAGSRAAAAPRAGARPAQGGRAAACLRGARRLSFPVGVLHLVLQVGAKAVDKEVALREANQRFSEYVRAVEAGESFVITRRGRPVARLVPIEAGRRALTPEQQAARARALERMQRGIDLGAPAKRFDRDALHER
jgi:prevent-host-death family protein